MVLDAGEDAMQLVRPSTLTGRHVSGAHVVQRAPGTPGVVEEGGVMLEVAQRRAISIGQHCLNILCIREYQDTTIRSSMVHQALLHSP